MCKDCQMTEKVMFKTNAITQQDIHIAFTSVWHPVAIDLVGFRFGVGLASDGHPISIARWASDGIVFIGGGGSVDDRWLKWSQVGRRRVGALVGVRSARKSGPSASRVGCGLCESRALKSANQ